MDSTIFYLVVATLILLFIFSLKINNIILKILASSSLGVLIIFHLWLVNFSCTGIAGRMKNAECEFINCSSKKAEQILKREYKDCLLRTLTFKRHIEM